MKRLLYLIAICYCPLIFANNHTGTLTINTVGIDPKGNCVSVALYDNAKSFAAGKTQAAYYAVKQRVTKNHVTFIISQLPYGKYAFSGFQDVKCTGIIPENSLGQPTVAYGFSRNVTGVFGSTPSFDRAAIKINKAQTHVSLTLES